MKIKKNLEVPTGNILIVDGEKGNLEMLSLGDHGKDVNVKCDVLGLSRPITDVKHTQLLPLSKKWVLTISTQYGCSMNCTFCDVHKVGPGRNATELDLMNQVLTGLSLHPEIKATERLNIHFARMGEPTFNGNVLKVMPDLLTLLGNKHKIHPVVSTMMPKSNQNLSFFISTWMDLKNILLRGEAGLQLSINSTCEKERSEMFSGNCHTMEDIAKIMDGHKPLGRKITLNFALADYEISPEVLLKYFDPDLYIIKITPMHKTKKAQEAGIKTTGDYTTYTPYEEVERRLREAGYDVLVFVASEYEDMGRITCGNAILSGSLPEVPYRAIVG